MDFKCAPNFALKRIVLGTYTEVHISRDNCV